MLIQPDSNIRLIKNCPLNNSYRDTIYFNNRQEQYDYFKTKFASIPFTKQSYQRYDKGVLHIQENAENLYECNYLMFQNASFGNKWFYAFINSIEYVNNVSSKIYYEIDVLQTWLSGENNDYTIYPCYVERQHTETDNIGDNITPEDLNTGDYIYSQQTDAVDTSMMYLVVQYTGDLPEAAITLMEALNENLERKFKTISEMTFCGVYHDTKFVLIPLNYIELTQINEFINAINIATFGGLINVFMMPKAIAESYINMSQSTHPTGWGYFIINRPTTIDGHIPKNNKMYTAPYVVACLSNNLDNEQDYAFERFNYGDSHELAVFEYVCPMESNARIMAYPKQYNGVDCNTKVGIHSVALPQCGYAGDKFTNWVANNSLGLIASCLQSPIHSPIQFPQPITPNNTATSIALAPKQNVQQSPQPIVVDFDEITNRLLNVCAHAQHTCVGSNSQSSAMYGVSTGLITGYVKTLKREIAEIVDSYFTMFGYAIKCIRTPNLKARTKFTYIKTNGFSAKGAVPAEVMKKICYIHDRGVTYWNKDSVVGDYSQDNYPW